MDHPHRLTPGQEVRLSEFPTSGKEFHRDRSAAEKEFRKLRRELIEWQRRLYSAGSAKLLIVLQGMDASGKDGATRHVFRGVNPQGVTVTSFKEPTATELAHDYLWRVHARVPAAGMIGVFNRSHYEDVLIVRVNNLVSQEEWRSRYAQINDFERLLSETGTRILKFYLHLSQKEQKKRFKDRLAQRDKRWKFCMGDLDKRDQWEDYMTAYAEALSRCSTTHAPWYVIPADQRWYRNLAICRVIVEELREVNPQYPERTYLPETIEVR